jgi:ADP-heptose:LPS heptosyltransferase
VARHEEHLAENIKGFAVSAVHTMSDLNIKEVIALAAQASLFIGNDSGPAHIAAATRCPTIVIFGSSDPNVWRPWGPTPHVVVQVAFDHGGVGLPPAERIKHVRVEHVVEAIDHLFSMSSVRDPADTKAVKETAQGAV